jgi:hypothetical protein
MKRVLTIVAVAVALLSTDIAPGQDETQSSNYEQLRDLEDFIGEWVAETTLGNDVPGFGKQGDRVVHRTSAKWILNRNVMQLDLVSQGKDGQKAEILLLCSWDAAAKRIVYHVFHSQGICGHGTMFKKSADTWIWQGKATYPDGVASSQTDVMTIRDDNNTHVHEYTDRILDGKPQPDRRVVYRRVKR